MLPLIRLQQCCTVVHALTFDSISALTFLLMPNSGETRCSACLAAREDDDIGDDAGGRKPDTGVTCDSAARKAPIENARTSGRFRLLVLLLRLLPNVRGDMFAVCGALFLSVRLCSLWKQS